MAKSLRILSIIFILVAFETIIYARSSMHNERNASAHFVKDKAETSLASKRFQSIFLTNFSPGLNLFNNTVSGKVQESPNGEVDLLYNERHTMKDRQEIRNKVINASKTGKSSNTKKFNRLSSKKKSPSTTTPPLIGKKSNPQITECLDQDEIKNNKTYCSNLRNYPNAHDLDELVEDSFPNLKAMFVEDSIAIDTTNQRLADAPNEEFFCRSRQRVIYPHYGLNENYEWMHIFNSDNYKQGVRIEECFDVSGRCIDLVDVMLPSPYQASCEQQYIYRTLVAYSPDKGTLFKDSFRLPASCKCVLKNPNLF